MNKREEKLRALNVGDTMVVQPSNHFRAEDANKSPMFLAAVEKLTKTQVVLEGNIRIMFEGYGDDEHIRTTEKNGGRGNISYVMFPTEENLKKMLKDQRRIDRAVKKQRNEELAKTKAFNERHQIDSRFDDVAVAVLTRTGKLIDQKKAEADKYLDEYRSTDEDGNVQYGEPWHSQGAQYMREAISVLKKAQSVHEALLDDFSASTDSIQQAENMVRRLVTRLIRDDEETEVKAIRACISAISYSRHNVSINVDFEHSIGG